MTSKPAPIGTVIDRRDSVASTMDAVRDLDRDGAVVVARSQTEGRGRHGRTWHSPKGGLYMSALVRPPIDPGTLGLVPLWTGLAVVRALEHFDVAAQVSWPNDVLIGPDKVAGVLSESATAGPDVDHVVLGVGVNVNTEALPDDIPWTSLEIQRGSPVDLTAVEEALLDALQTAYAGFLDDPTGFLGEYRDRCRTLGRRVGVRTAAGNVRGRATGIDEQGELVVETADGPVRVRAGDVEEVVE